METSEMPVASLKDWVRAELNKRKGKFPKISQMSGWSYSALHQFADGRQNNPSFDRLQRLATLFSTGVI